MGCCNWSTTSVTNSPSILTHLTLHCKPLPWYTPFFVHIFSLILDTPLSQWTSPYPNGHAHSCLLMDLFFSGLREEENIFYYNMPSPKKHFSIRWTCKKNFCALWSMIDHPYIAWGCVWWARGAAFGDAWPAWERRGGGSGGQVCGPGLDTSGRSHHTHLHSCHSRYHQVHW